MSELRHDVFICVAGPDRLQVRHITRALREAGLDVFVDEDDAEHFASVSAQIEGALRASTLLLAYYSTALASRWACQFELTAALLAGYREGNRIGRIVVVNPEDDTAHLHPAELADARFALLPNPRDAAAMNALVENVRRRIGSVSGAIGGVPLGRRPAWYGERVAGENHFVGRYREQWLLHSQLHRADFPLTKTATSAPIASLVGISGSGKSALAAAYAWQFSVAHLGGVYWVSLAGAEPTVAGVRSAFDDQLRALAVSAWPQAQELPAAHIRAIVSEQVAAQSEPSLLVVDDIPMPLDQDVVDTLAVQAGDRLRTVLISSAAATPDGPAWPVNVGPLALADAVALLDRYRTADSTDEVEAREQVAHRLGRHAFALRHAGRALRDRHGFLSYRDFARKLAEDPATLAPVTSVLRAAMSELDDVQRLILQLSTVCSTAPLPVALIDRVARMLSCSGQATGDAIVALSDRFLANRIGDTWQVHTLVRDAAVALEASVAVDRLTTCIAEAILEVGVPEDGGTGQMQYLPHALALAARPELDPELCERLLRRAAKHYERTGQPYLALPAHRMLVQRHPSDPDELIAAAFAAAQSGEPEEALGYGSAALAVPLDKADGPRALQVVAEALDAGGRFAEADEYWVMLDAAGADAGMGRLHQLSAQVARIRSMRLRGHTRAARAAVEQVIAAEPDTGDEAVFDHLQAARLELAAIHLATDDSRSARRIALAIVDGYRQHGRPYHRHALDAQRLFADAQLTPYFWQLHTQREVWLDAETTLRRMRDEHRRTHGPRHTFTLALSVAHTHALVSLGEPEQARAAVMTFRSDLLGRLGPRHPMHLQACFLLGQAYAQLGDYQQAVSLYGAAFQGTLAALGAHHPQTLQTQFEYGVALKMTGQGAAAARMFASVRKAAPHSVGSATDLYWQSVFATGLNLLPTRIWWAARAKPKRR